MIARDDAALRAARLSDDVERIHGHSLRRLARRSHDHLICRWSAAPAFMGRILPICVNVNYSAHHAEKKTDLGMQMRLRNAWDFADFVRRTRTKERMTQEELAQSVRKSRRWVHDLEAGKVTPSLGAAIDVAAVLGYEVQLHFSEHSAVLDQVFEDLEIPSDT